jgi:hypothetical protein
MEEFRKTSIGDLFWDLLTFDRLMTGPVIHIIYWAGLATLVLGGFGAVGAAVGVASHEEGMNAVLLAAPILVFGVLFLAAGVLIWRAFCEFYVALFRISEDLRAMRGLLEGGARFNDEPAAAETPPPPRAPRGRKATV